MKANDYQKDLVKAREKLMLESRAKSEADHASTDLRDESEHILYLEQSSWVAEHDALELKVEQLCQEVDQKENTCIVDLQQLTDVHK